MPDVLDNMIRMYHASRLVDRKGRAVTTLPVDAE
jgi:hypothetical protein